MSDLMSRTGRIVTQSVTRPANTTQYAAGDVVTASTAALLSFVEAVGKGRVSTLVGATIIGSANQGTKPDLELWLFDTSFTPQDDNAAWAPSDAELRGLLGVVAFAVANFKVANAGSGADGNVECQVQNIQLPVWSLVDGGVVYGLLIARNTYTPVSAERFDVRLHLVD